MNLSAARLVIAMVLLIFVGGCFGAYQVGPDTVQTVAGMTPNVKDKDAGLVAVAPGFDIKTYKVVAVEKFPVTDTAVKDDDDRRNAEAISAIFQSELVRRLRATGQFSRVVNVSETEFQPGAEKTLRLQGVITRLGGGSQAARAMVGLFGAGAARVQAEMRLVDAQSAQPQIVTADRRQATAGFFGGDKKDHWRESVDDMARDFARFLVRLSQGQAPAK